MGTDRPFSHFEGDFVVKFGPTINRANDGPVDAIIQLPSGVHVPLQEIKHLIAQKLVGDKPSRLVHLEDVCQPDDSPPHVLRAIVNTFRLGRRADKAEHRKIAARTFLRLAEFVLKHPLNQ